MLEDLIPVNIVIGDRSYRLKIEPKDEELVRKIIKLINDRILEFKTNFAGKDMQDYIAMALIWFATEQSRAGSELIAYQEISEKLAAMEAMVERGMEGK
ncbi:cell division protein ZapA [Filimonas effusa]|uniref:Cell division protein ZapA n=1 Tax=Filimonas effusa TaxID=2508721 RepID=A0A4Q1D698_9BACT|nr:cell division protein ZapA [Filimonas effusa]RXK83403.1 cell division protein ZapA [Filimonas effusa]